MSETKHHNSCHSALIMLPKHHAVFFLIHTRYVLVAHQQCPENHLTFLVKCLKSICQSTPFTKKWSDFSIWVFPKIVVPQNGWFIMEIPIKMDDLGGKTPIFGNTHIHRYQASVLKPPSYGIWATIGPRVPSAPWPCVRRTRCNWYNRALGVSMRWWIWYTKC